MYDCKIVADSIAENGARLTTFEVTYPLIIHAEIMTHRVFSRNVASNRAIPVKKLIASVEDNPFIPENFPKNQAGMQAAENLDLRQAELARMAWLEGRNQAVDAAKRLMDLNVHKQISNRLLAPYLWTTAVITATDWNNFFSLRCHPMAQPEIQRIAYMMRDAFEKSTPSPKTEGEWHLPYVTDETVEQIKTWMEATGVKKSSAGVTIDVGKVLISNNINEYTIKTSIGRCARVSYLNHGDNNAPEKDIELCERLIESRHMSPTEHIAAPAEDDAYYGNFRGWEQYRKFLPGESGE